MNIPAGYIMRDGELHKLTAKPEPQPESELHDQIAAYCRSRKWYFVHSRMDRRTTTAKGVPDFIIACDDGQTLWVECKRKGAKPSIEQLGTNQWLKCLKHRAHIVWSYDEFLQHVGESNDALCEGGPQGVESK